MRGASFGRTLALGAVAALTLVFVHVVFAPLVGRAAATAMTLVLALIAWEAISSAIERYLTRTDADSASDAPRLTRTSVPPRGRINATFAQRERRVARRVPPRLGV